MRLVHTSDWHLGKLLCDRARYDEHEAFLNWLSAYILKEDIDCLIIAGDIFDTTTPSHQALSLYFQFLHRIASKSNTSVVIIGGNHDSPTLLNAPDLFLREFQIHVIGATSESHANEVIPILREGKLCALICAVPYLRERDLASLNPCEDAKTREERIKRQLYSHYQGVYVHAIQMRKRQHSQELPIIGTGHLFTTGGMAGDGVRSLYLGDICHMEPEQFPPFDYLALGHLHRHQSVSGDETKQYSGTPIPMGFLEAANSQYILDVTVTEKMLRVTPVEIPRTVEIVSITGDIDQIQSEIFAYKATGKKILAEVMYTGTVLLPDLAKKVRAWVDGSLIVVIRIANVSMYSNSTCSHISHDGTNETALSVAKKQLERLDEKYVFSILLEKKNIEESQRAELWNAYHQLCTAVHEHDRQAYNSKSTSTRGFT